VKKKPVLDIVRLTRRLLAENPDLTDEELVRLVLAWLGEPEPPTQ